MPRRNYKSSSALLWIPAFLGAALLIAAKYQWFGLEIDPKVKPSDALSVFTTVFLALLIQRVWARKAKRSEAQKDLILSHISDTSAAVRAIHVSIRDVLNLRPIPVDLREKLVVAFEDCGQTLSTLEVVVENSDSNELLTDCQVVSAAILKYKQFVTGGSYPNRVFGYEDISSSYSTQRELAKLLQLLSLKVSSTD